MKRYPLPALADVPLATVMQALADPCRLAIVRALLAEDGLPCNAVELEIAKATRSHHFAVLREAGLIETRTEGTKCRSFVRRREVEKRFPGLLDLVARGEPARRTAR